MTRNPFVAGEYGLDRRYQLAATVATGSTLPQNATDGATLRFKALTTTTGALADVWWTLTYDASAAYWYVTGPPLQGYSATSIASSVTNTWQQTTTPTIIVPFAGDYDVYAASVVAQSTASANCQVGPATAAVATPTAGAAEANFVANETQSLDWRSLFAGVAASTDFRHSQWTNDATPGHTATTGRTLIVTPLRVH